MRRSREAGATALTLRGSWIGSSDAKGELVPYTFAPELDRELTPCLGVGELFLM